MTDLRRARFETIVALVAEPVSRYALRRTDRDTAQDVLADTLLAVWRRLDDVPEGAELPWCYGVARNCLSNIERTQRRQHHLIARLTLLDRPRHAPPPDADDASADPALTEALARLGEADREVLRLWAWEELAPHEIAATLGITANAASIRLHRAKRRLAGLLEPHASRLSRWQRASGKDPSTSGHSPVDKEEPR